MRIPQLSIELAHYYLPAAFTELRSLHVQPFDPITGRHDAPPVRAVAQAEGVAEFVDRGFKQPLSQQVFARRHAVKLFAKPGDRYGGTVTFQLRLAENK